MAIVLLSLAVLGAVRRAGAPSTRRARAALVVPVSGFALLLAGNVVEFWAVLFQDRLNAFAAGSPPAVDLRSLHDAQQPLAIRAAER